jgi:beta-aspartyl-peptidase (threonine type)
VIHSYGTAAPADFLVLVHGGAGAVKVESLERHIAGCMQAARVAAERMRVGGTAEDAALVAVMALEDDPLFNAGTGASLDEDGALSLDAAIMEGAELRAGAVCALPPFKNPIAVAKAVMDDGEHVLYAADGAARFATQRGFSPADPESMITELSREKFLAVRERGERSGWAGGTVGAVVVHRGQVVAATSTGGKINKRRGRVGDSPILGAGTYADDHAGACSATGDGERFMRTCMAKVVIDRLTAGDAPEAAARTALERMVARVGGDGGLIVVDSQGRMGLARNTKTMTWGAMAHGWDEPRGGS